MDLLRIAKAQALADHRLRLTLTDGSVMERDVTGLLADRSSTCGTDVTGDFCISGSERESHAKERWYANETIQAGTDHGVVAPG